MTTRFYGGQRSGNENWLLYNHLPSGVNAALRGLGHRADYNTTDNVDLSGGWNDCGDHVKFGQTQFYSAYMLIKGYTEFKTGYDDKYAYDYNGYETSGQWNYEGTGHAPNCIPDVLDEMKHETDFLIKCTPNTSTFWYQVGDGGGSGDHCQRVTAVKMQTYAVNCGGNNDNGTPGARRPSCKNPNEAVMASLAAAALAVMAREYQPYDAAYAALCLTHAQNAYTYASTRLGGGTQGSCFGGFYGAPAAVNNYNAFVCAASELYTTTGTASYLTTANGHYGSVAFNGGWAFDYANIGELALYCLAENGHAAATTAFNNRITGHYMAAGSRNGAGVYTANGTWGRLRYNGNAAFLISLYSKLNNNTTAAVINAIHNDVDYMMGKNTQKQTYIVGYTPAAGGPFLSPQYPHHRNAFLDDNNVGNATNLPLPAKNAQMGALVGGQRDGSYNDSWQDYVNSEVCIDYNAGLVGALGFINARLAPISGACQTCRTPNIGANQSTCTGSIFPLVLTDASTPGAIPSGVTYTWNRLLPSAVSNVGTAGASAKIRNIAASDCPSFPCSVVVIRDSTGGCSRRDTVTITNNIATPILTGPLNLCSPASYNLVPTNVGSFPGGTTWQWSSDLSIPYATYNNITGATSSTLANVRTAGSYRITATAGSCNSNATVDITSSLPTPVDGCRTGTGTVGLSITNNVGTNYNWYNAATAGSVIPGGTGTISVTSPSISSTTTYYVQDMNAVNTTVGPTTQQGAGQNWGINTGNHLHFTANSNFALNSFQVPFGPIYANDPTATITIEILDGSGNPLAPTQIFTSNPMNVTTAMANSLITFTFTGVNIQSSWGPSLRMRATAKTTNGDLLWSSGPASYPYNSAGGIVSITGESGGSGANEYMYFYNWNISTGTACDRLPVIAQVGGCIAAPIELIYFKAEKDAPTRTVLSWVTGSETNNKLFQIERSLDAKNFEVIGTLNGMGNTNGATSYSFADENTPYGLVYYRLVQFDFDGQFSMSDIVSVNSVSSLSLGVAPNPFTNATDVIIRSNLNEKAHLKIIDLSGLTLFEEEYTANQNYSIGGDLPSGVYFVQVQLADAIKIAKIIKQ